MPKRHGYVIDGADMITTLMFHRVYANGFPEFGLFEQFLRQLSTWGMVCLPGQAPSKGKHGICLTFDDAYFDFYQLIFPILKKYQIPAVLAIPTSLIADTVPMQPEERLNLQFNQTLNNQVRENPALCSWQEIKEMVASGWVIPACHSASHVQLTEKSDLAYEVLDAKNVLEQKTNHPVDIFVYPFGQFDKSTHLFVRKHYTYIMRIGSAINFNWNPANRLIYRINADNYWPLQKNPFNWIQKANFARKSFINSMRGR